MSRKFIVESRLRLNPNTETTSNFTVNVPNFINVNKLRLVEATIPLSYFIINSSNSTISFTETGTGTWFAILAPGNYTGTSIAAVIATAMNSTGATGPFSAVVDPNTGILTISTAGPTFRINTVSVASDPSNIGRILGFGSTATGFAVSHTSPGILNLAGPNELYITSSVVNGPLEEVIILSFPDVTNIVDRIPVFQKIGTIQTLTQFDPSREVFISDPDTFVVLDIQVRLPGGAIVDLNGADVTLVFEFE